MQQTFEVENYRQFNVQDAELQKAKLKETLTRAVQSPLYKKLWHGAHVKPENIQSISDLNRIPYLPSECLFEATKTKPRQTCIGSVGQWFLGHDRIGTHEWYPYSNEDFLGIAQAFSRLTKTVGLRQGDVVLVVVDTPPHISSFIPFLWTYSQESRDCGLEFINGSMEWYDTLGMSWITFIQKRQPTAILATKRNAAILAEKLDAMDTSVEAALPKLRLAAFLTDDSAAPLQSYAFTESFEVYSPLEHMAFWSECKSHSGIHVWLDGCIPEILPGGQKEAELLTKTAVGKAGELVLTTFASALPLIRYKTGKHIRVESVGKCSCGASHPKIRFIP